MTQRPKKPSNPRNIPPEYEEYVDAVERLLNAHEISEWKIARALEIAKSLSVNWSFQQAIYKFRERWNIQPTPIMPQSNLWAIFDGIGSNLTESERSKFDNELKVLAKHFDLDWAGNDYGLMVLAVCYGLTVDNVLKHWGEMKFFAAQTRTGGVQIILDGNERIKNLAINMVAISYLYVHLVNTGTHIVLPEALRNVILQALKTVGKVDIPERAVEVTKLIQEAEPTVDLYLKLESETTLEDVTRTWPNIELRQLAACRRGNLSPCLWVF